MKTTSNGRRPQILKVKYLSNYWSDLHQILNLNICNQEDKKQDWKMLILMVKHSFHCSEKQHKEKDNWEKLYYSILFLHEIYVTNIPPPSVGIL